MYGVGVWVHWVHGRGEWKREGRGGAFAERVEAYTVLGRRPWSYEGRKRWGGVVQREAVCMCVLSVRQKHQDILRLKWVVEG